MPTTGRYARDVQANRLRLALNRGGGAVRLQSAKSGRRDFRMDGGTRPAAGLNCHCLARACRRFRDATGDWPPGYGPARNIGAYNHGPYPREAARLYRIAAEAGNPVAKNNLGAMFEAGEGALPRNPREAARLYRLAADQEYPAAQANLAALYDFGRSGLARDDREAVRLWQRAAEREESGAQTNLGTMYATGRGGLPRDDRKSARMWRLAAEQGSTEA